jgi:RnfABCDGE-type electron transport complex B subunit
MNIVGIVIATAVIAITGLAIGLLLGVAGKKFAVEVDEKEIAVRELLPGNNCGGCGYAGCDALAKAIANGEAKVNACPVGGEPVGEAISAVMGVEAGASVRMVANVACSGTCEKTTKQYDYNGLQDCRKLSLIPGRGEKACDYGCMGLGSCVRECPFDAIHIIDGIAKVDREACKACGKCVAICPNHLISLVPYDAKYIVVCKSNDKGKDVRSVCKTGCIGCGICVKQCEFEAVTVENNLATIDPSKCTGCGKCAEKCPAKVIHKMTRSEI